MERLYIYSMKRILLIAICLFVARVTHAQQPSITLNENNRYVYYEVVDMPGISADSLKKNAIGFIMAAYSKNESKKVTDTVISVKDKFLNYSAVIKHENGEMAYTLNIQCKDARYRYWLTDFVFTPYQRNRYGVFVPTPGIEIPMETAKDKLEKKDAEAYLTQTNVFCKQLADKLKQYMVTGHATKKINQKPTKVVTDKW